MFRIEDGREHLYQWDMNVRLIVEDDTVNEVHFCNRTDDCSLVCEVYEEGGLRYADIPNILLQFGWPIRAYAYHVNHTITHHSLKVVERTKPANYIYTETEVKNYDDLVARIDEIEQNGVSQEVIDAAVGAYFEENPIDTGATAEQAAQIEQNRLDIAELKSKPDVDLTGYATEKYVNDLVSDVEIKIPDTSDFLTAIPEEYVTETELNAKGYQTEAQVTALIQANMPASGDEVSY